MKITKIRTYLETADGFMLNELTTDGVDKESKALVKVCLAIFKELKKSQNTHGEYTLLLEPLINENHLTPLYQDGGADDGAACVLEHLIATSLLTFTDYLNQSQALNQYKNPNSGLLVRLEDPLCSSEIKKTGLLVQGYLVQYKKELKAIHEFCKTQIILHLGAAVVAFKESH